MTVLRSLKLAWPLMTRTPRPVKRSTESTGAIAAITRCTCSCTLAKSIATPCAVTPNAPEFCISAARLAAASKAFDGTQPVLRQSPPILCRSIRTVGTPKAAAAAAFGVPTVLIERHKMGGDCLNTGCVPSKALLAAAKRAALMQNSGAFGVTAQGVAIDFAKVHEHVQRVIAAIAPVDSVERFTGLGVRVIKGHASFKDHKTVVVGDKYEIRARRFVIASGSTPAVPPISGLDQGPYFTNESIFNLTALPKHLIVIGAGPIGLELAQAFRRLGSAVTVCEAAQPLAKDDPECAAIVLDQLEREGVV